ncbi:O-antigen ligase family protein [Pseudomonas promysalinigenes]|uniref:O-antigen ligase family protein n=1 Tax=Pseudomonas promysalinigenes TaxID=485898 RepID=UPI0037CB6E17
MPEHLRALVVIVFVASVVFFMARRPATDLIPPADFKRRRNLWFVLTLVAFFAQSFWVYAGAATVILLVAQRREHNPLALFFMLLFLIPPAATEIPGFGIVNYLFDINHQRVLTLCVLLPAAWVLRKQSTSIRFGRLLPDKLLLASLALTSALALRETTVTDTLRQMLSLYIDVFLPYYVASRGLRELSDFKDALLAFVIVAFLLALLGVAEYVRHWLLYNALIDALGLQWDMKAYLSRGGALRASVTTGQAIVLGYVMAVAIGLFLFVQHFVQKPVHRYLGALLLAAGLFAPLSRGPWIGAGVIVVVFIAMGRHAASRLALLTLAGVLSIPLLAVMPGGDKILDLLPFIGKVDTENITYRQRLLDNSWIVIQRNPLFGSFDFRSTPEMQSMIQGEGIIDIVNTYVGLALRVGLVGLGLFLGFFAYILLGLRKAMRAVPDNADPYRLLGRVLLATLMGILVTIFTVSSITVIPIIYWSIAGVSVAYIHMMRRQAVTQDSPVTTISLQTR